ncbi:hypothetical protein K469DRAFT_344359 [Zopfia rhizophila CBS 207.26]|uniref:Uncharacterized protein n=1 Tax=Zopfia rhizophila CBS 207.26 TaxID=1314779 RepID=A0A6A6ELE6_9PEZI|nr:hypothetical protein K469DRAFT_344359 [Zopfia rhizophila CBS 207.26]
MIFCLHPLVSNRTLPVTMVAFDLTCPDLGKGNESQLPWPPHPFEIDEKPKLNSRPAKSQESGDGTRSPLPAPSKARDHIVAAQQPAPLQIRYTQSPKPISAKQAKTLAYPRHWPVQFCDSGVLKMDLWLRYVNMLGLGARSQRLVQWCWVLGGVERA